MTNKSSFKFVMFFRENESDSNNKITFKANLFHCIRKLHLLNVYNICPLVQIIKNFFRQSIKSYCKLGRFITSYYFV